MAGKANLAYTIKKSVNGEGQGVFAARDIRQGEVIVEEEPLIYLDYAKERLLKGQVTPARVYEVWEDLKKGEKDWFQTLSYSDGKDTLEQNAMDALKPGNEICGLVVARYHNNCFFTGLAEIINKRSSRFNHSCEKNASWAGNAQSFVVRAIRDIKKGEEILISYIRVIDTRAVRKHELKAYGFDCNCSVCNLSSAAGKETDTRRRQLSVWNKALPSVPEALAAKTISPEAVKQCQDMLLELSKEPSMLDEMCIKYVALPNRLDSRTSLGLPCTEY